MELKVALPEKRAVSWVKAVCKHTYVPLYRLKFLTHYPSSLSSSGKRHLMIVLWLIRLLSLQVHRSKAY